MERSARLGEVLADLKRIRNVDHVADGLGLFAASEKVGVEGIVSKKALAPYRRGKTGDLINLKTTAGKTLIGDRSKWDER